MSNSRFIQSLLWPLHNNYVAKYGLKKHFNPYLSLGCVKEVFCTQNIKRLIFYGGIFSTEHYQVRFEKCTTKFLGFLKVFLKNNFYKLE